ncbi:hypothetical protein AVEN_82577-1 [Araneus ventricosus]|uniref:Secreted protein n=1 Tax=Araneus ventricosus TaxID=182803 RepID=A0A4Y2IVG9_ARAVE|nr:hypothetical protein AVEN_82577-1 [Araneus ventricosus]
MCLLLHTYSWAFLTTSVTNGQIGRKILFRKCVTNVINNKCPHFPAPQMPPPFIPNETPQRQTEKERCATGSNARITLPAAPTSLLVMHELGALSLLPQRALLVHPSRDQCSNAHLRI